MHVKAIRNVSDSWKSFKNGGCCPYIYHHYYSWGPESAANVRERENHNTWTLFPRTFSLMGSESPTRQEWGSTRAIVYIPSYQSSRSFQKVRISMGSLCNNKIPGEASIQGRPWRRSRISKVALGLPLDMWSPDVFCLASRVLLKHFN